MGLILIVRLFNWPWEMSRSGLGRLWSYRKKGTSISLLVSSESEQYLRLHIVSQGKTKRQDDEEIKADHHLNVFYARSCSSVGWH